MPAKPAGAADDPVVQARQRAIAWLHTQQLPDGSFGQRMAGGKYAASPTSTADSIYLLALLGEDPGGPAWTVGGQNALDALARLAPDYARADAGQAGKVARAVAAARGDPHNFAGLDLVKIITSFYDPASGRFGPDLLFRHTLAIEGLMRAGVTVPPAAFDALWQARLPDGGWFWAFQGDTSDLDTTGRVVQVLSQYGQARCAPALAPSVAYLAAHQDDGGGWGASQPPGPPNANSTALAVAGLGALGYDVNSRDGVFARNGRGALETLLSFQEASGAFVYIRQPGREESRLAATLDALTALLPGTGEGAACEITYLPVRLAVE